MKASEAIVFDLRWCIRTSSSVKIRGNPRLPNQPSLSLESMSVGAYIISK